jgi:hypothetical protein
MVFLLPSLIPHAIRACLKTSASESVVRRGIHPGRVSFIQHDRNTVGLKPIYNAKQFQFWRNGGHFRLSMIIMDMT